MGCLSLDNDWLLWGWSLLACLMFDWGRDYHTPQACCARTTSNLVPERWKTQTLTRFRLWRRPLTSIRGPATSSWVLVKTHHSTRFERPNPQTWGFFFSRWNTNNFEESSCWFFSIEWKQSPHAVKLQNYTENSNKSSHIIHALYFKVFWNNMIALYYKQTEI